MLGDLCRLSPVIPMPILYNKTSHLLKTRMATLKELVYQIFSGLFYYFQCVPMAYFAKASNSKGKNFAL